jgi:hypothetical protein
MPVTTPPKAPAWVLAGLEPAGRRFVRAVVAEYEGLAADDWQLVALAARQLDRAQAAAEALAGESVPDMARLIRIERAATSQFAALTKQLGLNREDDR